METKYVTLFNNLEISSTQMDIWIDEENYNSIWKSSWIELETYANSNINDCFTNKYCTFKSNNYWRKALHLLPKSLPVIKINNFNLKQIEISTNNEDNVIKEIIEYWSHLIYCQIFSSKNSRTKFLVIVISIILMMLLAI
jgi:hypothetical protein